MKCNVCKETDEFFAALCTRADCPHEVEKQYEKIESELVGEDTTVEVLEQFAEEDQADEIATQELDILLGLTLDKQYANQKEQLHTSSNRKLQLPNGKTIVLNDQQEEALNLGVQWLQDRTALFFTLSGYAGTGKSTIAKEIIKEAINRHIGSIAVSAPTHKAKKVISNTTKLEGETIQSLLGLAPNVELADFDINKPEFSAKKKPTIEYYKLIVVDEASMLNKDLWEMLKEQARRFNTRLLLMGDSAQLPPVKEDKSMVFVDPDITYKFELSIVERQKDGNPLLVMYDLIRNNLHKEHDQFHKEDITTIVDRPDLETIGDPRSPQVKIGHEFINDRNKFGLQVVEAFRSEDFGIDPNYCKVLCWTNTQVEFWNACIRKTLIGDLARNKQATQEQLLHASVMIPNELLMSYSTYNDGLQNSGEYEVISMQFTEKKIHWGDTKQYNTMVQGYRVALLDIDQDTILNTFIVDPDTDNITAFTRIFNSYLFLAKTKKAWPAYFAFKAENLLLKEIRDAAGQLVCKKDLDYAYALTVHKSQGSSYDNVFIDLQDINKNKNWIERNKLKYVALSRPRYLATIYTGGAT